MVCQHVPYCMTARYGRYFAFITNVLAGDRLGEVANFTLKSHSLGAGICAGLSKWYKARSVNNGRKFGHVKCSFVHRQSPRLLALRQILLGIVLHALGLHRFETPMPFRCPKIPHGSPLHQTRQASARNTLQRAQALKLPSPYIPPASRASFSVGVGAPVAVSWLRGLLFSWAPRGHRRSHSSNPGEACDSRSGETNN